MFRLFMMSGEVLKVSIRHIYVSEIDKKRYILVRHESGQTESIPMSKICKMEVAA